MRVRYAPRKPVRNQDLVVLRGRQVLVRSEGDELSLRSGFLQQARSIRGHGGQLRGHLLRIGLCRREVRPRGSRNGSSSRHGRWKQPRGGHWLCLGEVRHFGQEVLQLVAQHLVFRLGGLRHLAEVSKTFAPIVIKFLVLCHGPVSKFAVLQGLHEDDILLLMQLDLLDVRRGCPGRRGGPTGRERKGGRFLEDRFEGDPNAGSPGAGASSSGHLSPRLACGFLSAWARRLTGIAPFVDTDGNCGSLMATAHRKGVAWRRFLGLR
eukprot:6476288-Amphidinium_carterae.2